MRISDWSSDVCSSDLRWQRGIAAEAYHHVWLKGFMETARHVSPGLDALQAHEPAHGTTRHSSGRQDMDRSRVKQDGDFRAPIIRDESQMMTKCHKSEGNGMGRKDMTARHPGCADRMEGNAYGRAAGRGRWSSRGKLGW